MLDPRAKAWSNPKPSVAQLPVEPEPGFGLATDLAQEQDWSLVDDATTFANTRANFHLTLPSVPVLAPASASSATAAFASPKHSKTVMWADQAAKVDENCNDSTASRASTSVHRCTQDLCQQQPR